MDYTLFVRAFEPQPKPHYDLFVAAVGYERRARYVVQEYQPDAIVKLGIGFTDRQVLEFERNRTILSARGYHVDAVSDGDLHVSLQTAIGLIQPCEHVIRVGVDISSFSRFRIATIVESLRTFAIRSARKCIADFYYSVAQFSRPPKRNGPNTALGPVAPPFAGWTSHPDLPLAAVLGLGYEEDKALGALEHVQAAGGWIVKPVSLDPRFDAAVEKANRRLLDGTVPGRILEYRVDDLLGCFGVIESLVFGLERDYNVLVLPFGPKSLALCSLLVACLHPNVAVWRVSAGGYEEPVNRKASGQVYCLQAEFSKVDGEVGDDETI